MPKKKSKKTAKNRYQHLAEAQVELDFHTGSSLQTKEVKRMTLTFLADAKRDGHRKVRIITGKGIHSKGAPVVKPQVERTLKTLIEQDEIRSYYPESARLGGDGAFVVEL